MRHDPAPEDIVRMAEEAEGPLSPIRVMMACTGEWISESKTEIQNIEEDGTGRDVLTFLCPRCGESHTSLRIG